MLTPKIEKQLANAQKLEKNLDNLLIASAGQCEIEEALAVAVNNANALVFVLQQALTRAQKEEE